jgi:hypothetical protein
MTNPALNAFLLLTLAPLASMALGIAVGTAWRYHWLGLALGLNASTVLIPFAVTGYGRSWAFVLACSGIASAVTACTCRQSYGLVRSWLIGTSSAAWLVIALVALFLFDPQGGPSRSIPWAPMAGFFLFGAAGSTVACAVCRVLRRDRGEDRSR